MNEDKLSATAGMSLEQLQEERQRMMRHRVEVNAYILFMTRKIDAILTEQAMQADLAAVHRKHKRKILHMKGIPSAEATGTG